MHFLSAICYVICTSIDIKWVIIVLSEFTISRQVSQIDAFVTFKSLCTREILGGSQY